MLLDPAPRVKSCFQHFHHLIPKDVAIHNNDEKTYKNHIREKKKYPRLIVIAEDHNSFYVLDNIDLTRILATRRHTRIIILSPLLMGRIFFHIFLHFFD